MLLQEEALIIDFCLCNHKPVTPAHIVPRDMVKVMGESLPPSDRPGKSFELGYLHLPSVAHEGHVGDPLSPVTSSSPFLSTPPLFFCRVAASRETISSFHFSRLGGVPEAEDLASQMLKGFPRDRVSAQDALVHDYFSVLPSQLYQLPDGECVCT